MMIDWGMVAKEITSWNLKEVITFFTALLGAILGVINIKKAYDDNTVVLKIIPQYGFFSNSADEMMTMDIINLSKFHVTIREIGFIDKKIKQVNPKRMAILSPIGFDDKILPIRLGPRESASFYFDKIDKENTSMIPRFAYAQTSCREIHFSKRRK